MCFEYIDGGDNGNDETRHELGSLLVDASIDWRIAAIRSKSETTQQFAQLQRPRSPVPAAAAIHERQEAPPRGSFAEVTCVSASTAGPCRTDCQMAMPLMVPPFFMTLLVAVTQVGSSI